MFQQVNVPIIGIVENMAYFTPEELPNNKYYIFGKEGGKRLADEYEIPFLGQIPLVQSIQEGGDIGVPPTTAADRRHRGEESLRQFPITDPLGFAQHIRSLRPDRAVWPPHHA